MDLDYIQEQLFENYLILLPILVIVLFILKRLLFKAKSSRRSDTIILTGPNGSGKTCFFYNLTSGKNQLCVSSLEINQFKNFKFEIENKQIIRNVIDFPGIGYFQAKVVENLINSDVILCFVDSTSKDSTREAGEYLYNIINDNNFDDNSNLIIVCSKSDSKFAKSKTIIEAELSLEIDSRKKMKQKNNLEEQTEQLGKLYVNF